MSMSSFFDSLPNRLDIFTDREEILDLFRRLLHSTQPGQFHVLSIKGAPGAGKTFLVEYLSSKICSLLGWQVGFIMFNETTPNFHSILEALEDGLKYCVSRKSLKVYRDKRDKYNHSFDEYRANITIYQSVEVKESSLIADNNQNVQVDTELRRREIQLRTELSRALVELAEECQHPLCLFIDGYERLAEAGSELAGWLWEVVFKLLKASPRPLLTVTCGWQWPQGSAIKPFMEMVELDDFDSEQVRSYLQKQHLLPSAFSSLNQEELTTTFYDLTRGQPLALSLAATYFGTLNAQEQTAVTLQANRSAINEKMRVEFFQERLLVRLPEPYRTLLAHGPILRYFDQITLQVLLSENFEDTKDVLREFNDQAYDHFVSYPFIEQSRMPSNDTGEIRPTFHRLVRRIGLSSLRQHHPQTKEKLNHKMAVYYGELLKNEQQLESAYEAFSFNNENIFPNSHVRWPTEIPKKSFEILLEWFYHCLQVKEFQIDAFAIWERLCLSTLTRWQRQQAIFLIELVKHLVEEGEPFLSEAGDPFNRYLIVLSRFLMQEAHWGEAQIILEKATGYFERTANNAALASCLNNTGIILEKIGKLEQALSCFERACSLHEQTGNFVALAVCRNNMGMICSSLGNLRLALNYLEQARLFQEQKGDSIKIAYILNNIGSVYLDLREWEQALSHFERALKFIEEKKDLLETAILLNNIGKTYQHKNNLEQALIYYEKSLEIREKMANQAAIATALSNIGDIYYLRKDMKSALSYYKRSLTLREEVGSPAEIAMSLNNIGNAYRLRSNFEEALKFHKQALALKKQVGNPIETAISHNNIGGIYLKLRRVERAVEHFNAALNIYQRLGQEFEEKLADNLEALAICFFQLGELIKAVSYDDRAKRIRKRLHKTS